MRDVLEQLERWLEAGERAALATVVGSRRSAPRPLGSKLAISESGALIGSVSGGCVEADVAREAREAIADGAPRLLSYGIDDETAQSVGLPCGGEIDVFLTPFGDVELVRRLREVVDRGERATLSTVVSGDAAGEMMLAADGAVDGAPPALQEEDGRTLFVEPLRPPPLLVAVGATDLAEALCRLAGGLGWRTVVVDPRAALLTRDRLPSAGELVRGWPDDVLDHLDVDSDSAVVVLSHDDKVDVPALAWALRSPAAYVGALGSRRRQERLRERLAEAGVDAERLAGPAGLDLGAHALEETALSILAEAVAVRQGRAGGRLRDAETAIHTETVR